VGLPKLPWGKLAVQTSKVPVGQASEAAQMIARYWDPAADEMSRAVAQDAFGMLGRDVSPPTSPAAVKQWSEIKAARDMWSDDPGYATELYNFAREDMQDITAMDRPGGGYPTEQQIERTAAVRDSRDVAHPSGYGEQVMGAALTAGVGAAALGASKAQAEEPEAAKWDRRATKFVGLPRERQRAYMEKLTDDEWEAMKAAIKRVKQAPAPAPAPVPAGPVDYSQYMPVPQETTWTPQQMDAIAPTTPKTEGPMSVAPRFVTNEERLAALTTGLPGGADYRTGPDGKGPVGLGEQADAAMGIVGSLQQEYIAPPLRAAQKFMREGGSPISGIPAAVERAVGAVAGPDVALAERALTEGILSLPLGPPSDYLTTPEQMKRAKAVADLPPNVGLGEQPVLSAALQSGAEGFAYLPLYLIDAPKSAAKLGVAARGAIGGALGELADPRREANALRGAVGGAVLGKGLELGFRGGAAAMSRVAREVEAIRTWKIDGLPFGEWAAKQGTVAVVPSTEVKALLDAPPVGDIKAGAKASFMEARRGPHGGIDMRPVQVTPEGKKVGPDVKVDPNATPVQRRSRTPVVAESPEVAAELEAMGAPVVRPGKVREMILNPADEGDVLLKEGGSYRTAFDEDGTLRLDALPEGDFLVGRVSDTGPVEFRPVKLRNLQIESLRRRDLVVVDTPEGPRFGWDRTLREVMPDGTRTNPDERLVVPINPAEKIPNSLTAPVVVGPKQYRLVTSTTEFNDILVRRDDLLEAERRAALDAADAAVAVQAQAAGVPVVETPVGPKVALSGDDIVPPEPPPQGPPPGGGGNGGDDGFSGVPLPPTPPNPALLADLDERAGLFRRIFSPAIVPPTVTGPLDASTAATFFASSRNADALQGRIEQASERLLKPALANLPPARRSQVFSTVTDFLEGRKSLTDLEKSAPELGPDIRAMVNDARARSKALDEYLQSKGFVTPLDIAVPGGGKEMAEFVKAVKESRTYLTKRYYAYDLKAGKWADYVRRQEKLYDELVAEYTTAVLLRRQDLKGVEKADLRAIAERDLDEILRDPDALAEAWGTAPGPGGLKGSDAADALRARAGAGIPENLRVFNERAKSWSDDQREVATMFVAGREKEEALAPLFQGEDGLKDIKFLQQTKERIDSDLPKWLKMALGPVESPFTRSSFTASVQEELAMRAAALDTLASAGTIMRQADLAATRPTALNGRPSEKWVKIPEQPRKFGQYAGQFVHPNYAGFLYFNETQRGFKNVVLSMLQKLGQSWKVGNTVMAWGSYVTNVLGNLQGLAMSGQMPLRDLFSGQAPKSFYTTIRHWQDFVKSPNRLAKGELTGADWIRDSIKYGITASDFVSAEFRALLDAGAKASLPGGKEVGGLKDFLLAGMDTAKRGFGKAAQAYGGVDPFFKHWNWINALERNGLDMKTGKLVDREAAVDFLKGWGGNEEALRGLPDAQLAERLKAGGARMIAESHPQPDRLGRVQSAIGNLGDIAGPLGGVNMFYRTASEVLRTQMMLPYRAFRRPGVAKSMAEMAALAAVVGVGAHTMKRQMGISEDEERASFMALPPHLRKYRPAATALPIKDKDGRIYYLDASRFFDGLKFFNGDPGGRPLVEGLMESPGQTMTNVAYNMTATGLGFGNVTDETMREYLGSLGVMPYPEQRAPVQPGLAAFADKVYKMAAPGFVKQAFGAVDRTMAGPGEQALPVEGAAAQLLTGGVVFPGGTPEEGAKQNRMLMQQRQRLMQPDRRREGQELGPFQTYDRDQARKDRLEKIQQINQIRR
jgi:hypothetical protein